MSMRNFWIETRADGVTTPQATGPRSRDGGFKTTISGKIGSESVVVFEIQGWVDGRGGKHIVIDNGRGQRIADETFS